MGQCGATRDSVVATLRCSVPLNKGEFARDTSTSSGELRRDTLVTMKNFQYQIATA